MKNMRGGRQTPIDCSSARSHFLLHPFNYSHASLINFIPKVDHQPVILSLESWGKSYNGSNVKTTNRMDHRMMMIIVKASQMFLKEVR